MSFHLYLASSHRHFFLFNDPSTTEIYTLSLHDALPIFGFAGYDVVRFFEPKIPIHPRDDLELPEMMRSEEHTSELQSLRHLVCRLLLEKKKKKILYYSIYF